MLKLGYKLDDVGTRLSWLDVADIIENSPKDSALARAGIKNDEVYAWINNHDLQSVLADVIDTLQMFMYVYISANSKHKPKMPKPYKRPWAQAESKNNRKFGKAPVTIADFEKFWSE